MTERNLEKAACQAPNSPNMSIQSVKKPIQKCRELGSYIIKLLTHLTSRAAEYDMHIYTGLRLSGMNQCKKEKRFCLLARGGWARSSLDLGMLGFIGCFLIGKFRLRKSFLLPSPLAEGLDSIYSVHIPKL